MFYLFLENYSENFDLRTYNVCHVLAKETLYRYVISEVLEYEWIYHYFLLISDVLIVQSFKNRISFLSTCKADYINLFLIISSLLSSYTFLYFLLITCNYIGYLLMILLCILHDVLLCILFI